MSKFTVDSRKNAKGNVTIPLGNIVRDRVRRTAKRHGVSMGELCRQAIIHCLDDLNTPSERKGG